MQFSFQKLREMALFRGLGDIHPFQTLGDVLPFRKLVDVPFFRRLGDLFSFQQLKDMPSFRKLGDLFSFQQLKDMPSFRKLGDLFSFQQLKDMPSFRKLGDIFPFQKLKDIPSFRKLGDMPSFRKLRNILSSLKDTISKFLLPKNDHFLGNNLLLICCILFPVALSTITYKVSMHSVVSHYFRYGSVTAGTARGSVGRRMAFVRRSENYGSDSEGNPFDDFIMLDGQFDPDRPISDLTLYHGRVIEGLTVTYNLRDGTTRTSIHGTANRDHLNNFTYLELSDKEIVNSVTGKVGVRGSSEKSSIVRLAFEVRNTATGNIRFLGPFGDTRDDGQGQDFAVPGPIFAFAGRDFGDQAASLQSLSFYSPHIPKQPKDEKLGRPEVRAEDEAKAKKFLEENSRLVSDLPEKHLKGIVCANNDDRLSFNRAAGKNAALVSLKSTVSDRDPQHDWRIIPKDNGGNYRVFNPPGKVILGYLQPSRESHVVVGLRSWENEFDDPEERPIDDLTWEIRTATDNSYFFVVPGTALVLAYDEKEGELHLKYAGERVENIWKFLDY